MFNCTLSWFSSYLIGHNLPVSCGLLLSPRLLMLECPRAQTPLTSFLIKLFLVSSSSHGLDTIHMLITPKFISLAQTSSLKSIQLSNRHLKLNDQTNKLLILPSKCIFPSVFSILVPDNSIFFFFKHIFQSFPIPLFLSGPRLTLANLVGATFRIYPQLNGFSSPPQLSTG